MASADTRQRILSAAERLFGDQGIESVSLRQVGAEAGQKHNSATQYHFGSKQDLVHAIFAWRMVDIDQRRREMLASIEAGEPNETEKLIRVLVEPLADLLSDPDGGTNYVRLIGQLNRNAAWDFTTQVDPELTVGFRRVLRDLERVLKKRHPRRVRAARIGLLSRQVADALARRAIEQTAPNFDGPPLRKYVNELVNYMVAALH